MKKINSGIVLPHMLLFFLFVPFFAFSTTNMWYPGTTSTFSGWPANWTAIPDLNDPIDLDASNARLDFVGDSFNPCAFYASDGNYFFIRMRVAISTVTSTTFRDSHWIYVDNIAYTNGSAGPNMPDYAITWDSKNNDPTKHGLELLTATNLTAVTYWSQLALDDIDGLSNQKIAPPDFNLIGDGYLRTIDMCATTNFGYTTFIDFAVKWSYIAANSALNTNQNWRLQFGSRNDANDHNFPQDDIAGNALPASVIADSWIDAFNSSTLSSSISIAAYAAVDGVQIDLWTVDENGNEDIVVYAWLNNSWQEVGRVAGTEVFGEGSNHYILKTPLLSVDNSYFFKVSDEAGQTFTMRQPILVKSIKMSAVEMDLENFVITFNAEPNHLYYVLASKNLAATASDWVRVRVSCKTASGWSPCIDQPFMGDPGGQTVVRVSKNSEKTYYKILRAD